MKIAKRCLISGKVQGVFFRQHTFEKAEELKLTGWVKNLPSGEVECLVLGEEKQVESFCEWLWQGSPRSIVTKVLCENATLDNYNNFSILR